MIIIYYRDKDGKITQHHAAPDDWTMEAVQERIDQYNSEPGHTTTAHAHQADNGSVEVYLFQKAAERKKWDAEALQDAISSIEDALDAVRGLEG